MFVKRYHAQTVRNKFFPSDEASLVVYTTKNMGLTIWHNSRDVFLKSGGVGRDRVCYQQGYLVYPNDPRILAYQKSESFSDTLEVSQHLDKISFLTHLRIDICQYLSK